MDILAVEGRNERLVELDEEMVGNFVAFVLDGFDALHLLGHAGVVREHFDKGFGAVVDVFGLLGEKVEETLFTRQKPVQDSVHDV